MKRLATFALCLAAALPCIAQERRMVVVVSEPGNADYETEFRHQAAAWQDLAARTRCQVTTIGLDSESPEGDLTKVEQTLDSLPKTGGDLWLVWIGHGTYDGRTANFNLRGRDIDSTTLAERLKPFTRRLVILNLFSASFPFVQPLAGENRLIIASARSTGERNHTRFGEKLADALARPQEADLDLDGSVSLLEATLSASAATRTFYEDAQRIQQEHAVIEDNGDSKPTPADRFKGLRAEPGDDGRQAAGIPLFSPPPATLPAAAIPQRDALENAIEELRKEKSKLPEDAYYAELETLMRKLAKVYGK